MITSDAIFFFNEKVLRLQTKMIILTKMIMSFLIVCQVQQQFPQGGSVTVYIVEAFS